jgi:hypothetical protein
VVIVELITGVLLGAVLIGLVVVAAVRRRSAPRSGGSPRRRSASRAGVTPRRRSAPRVPFAPADLMSEFEVSNAIGVRVTARRADEAPASRTRAQAYHASDGTRLMRATVLAGRAARAAMRLRRQIGRPLGRAGEEAYAGDDWVIGRRGALVVLLEQDEPGRWALLGTMPWLLDTALGRVPADEAGSYR